MADDLNYDHYLRVTLDNGTHTDQTYVVFVEGATDNFDPQFDANRLSDAIELPMLYTRMGIERMLINAVAPMQEGELKTFVMGARTEVHGDHTITFDHMWSLEYSLVLEDMKLGVFEPINEEEVYAFTTVSGDARDRFKLHFCAPVHEAIDLDLCSGSGDSVVVGTSVYNEARPQGADTFYNVTANGCDSIVTVSLNYLIDLDTLRYPVCDPVYADTVVTRLTASLTGCDSVVTEIWYLAEVPPVYQTEQFDTTCDPLLAGTVHDTLQSIFGCDSIVTTYTALWPSYADTTRLTTCAPDAAGTVTDSLLSIHGCDSLIVTITSLLPSHSDTIQRTTCDPAEAVTVVDSLLNGFGCDSVVTTITTLLPSNADTLMVMSCEAADTGMISDTLVNQYGCDSVVTTVTLLADRYNDTVRVTSCDPADAGSVTDTLQTVYGCDSVVHTITDLLPSYSDTLYATSCDPADTGTVSDTLVTVGACDSIITTITGLADPIDCISTGVESQSAHRAAVYPVPAGDLAVLELPEGHPYTTALLTDLSGRLLQEFELEKGAAQSVPLVLNELQKGIYLIRLEGQGKLVSMKLLRM